MGPAGAPSAIAAGLAARGAHVLLVGRKRETLLEAADDAEEVVATVLLGGIGAFTAVLLLVAFTLFRPGFWWDMVYPPTQIADPKGIVEIAETQPEA